MTTAPTEELAEALGVLDDQHTAGDVGPSLTCREAEALAAILSAVGGHDVAATWLYGHAGGDDDSGDLHACCPNEDCETVITWAGDPVDDDETATCPRCGTVVERFPEGD